MAVYHPEITVIVITKAFSDAANRSPESFKIEVDAPSFDGLLSDLEHMCKEILAAHIQRLVDDNVELLPLHVDVGYSVMSLQKAFTKTIKKAEFDTLKKSSIPDKPPTNLASLQNDIQYGIDMIRSVTADLKKNVQMIGVVQWQWHILNKHFGLVIPQEIVNLQLGFGNDKK